MKLILLTNLFPNPQEPIRGIFVADMAKYLHDKCEVIAISPLPWFPKFSFLKKFKNWYKFSLIPKKFKIGEINVLCPKYLAIPKLGFLHSMAIFIAIFPIIVRFKRDKKVDLINAHWIFPDGVAANWAAHILKLPVVLSAHGCDINLYSRFKLWRFQIIAALKSTNKITIVSSEQKNIVDKMVFCNNKTTVIKNGVDFGLFNLKSKKECRKKLRLDENSKIILFVGQLIEVKGFNYLIDAIERICKEGKNDVEVVAIGAGDLMREHERKANELGIKNNIIFVGEKDRNEIPYWFGACDVFCLSSIREGCPCVVLEALASGRPVIASRVGGIPELVNKNNGILFEPREVRELTEALNSALDKQWDENIIRDSIRDLSWENTANKYFRIFSEIVEKNKQKEK